MLLSAKKGIYLSIKSHCDKNGLDILSIIPRTFYIAPSDQSSQDDMEGFEAYNAQATSEGKNPEDLIWILKPASKTNRGFGIKVVRGLSAVMRTVHRVASAQSAASDNDCQVDPEQSNDKDNPLFKAAKRIARQDGYIVQQYLERPLLVDGRKFDIRCFVLVTVFEQRNGSKDKDLTAYFYPDAYVRTSSKKYSLDKLTDRATHLTNDAVQKHATNYGQFEQGNKLSLVEWQNLINKEYPHASSSVVASKVLPEIKRLCKLSIEACEQQLRCTEIQKSFELFGYDFMVTEDFDPLLIEVNTNPCLEFVCPLLTDIISNVIEDSFKIALDVAYPPPKSNRTKACDEACRLLQQESSRFEKLFPSS